MHSVFFWRLYLYRYVDQHYFATYGPSNNTDDLILTEARLSNTITLGATVNIAILSLFITIVDNQHKNGVVTSILVVNGYTCTNKQVISIRKKTKGHEDVGLF